MGLNLNMPARGAGHRGRAAKVTACLAAVLALAGCDMINEVSSSASQEPDAATAETAAKAEAASGAMTQAMATSLWVQPGAAVAGVGQLEWTERWWKWVGRFPEGRLPYRDPDGALCATAQEGPVWFLAGTDGQSDAKRHCRIPADKYLLVPVMNIVELSGGAGKPARGCEELRASAAKVMDHLSNSLVLLDGRMVGATAGMRIASNGCFDPGRGLFGGGHNVAASDGYWLMLSPLPPGKHVLAISAGYDDKGPLRSLQNFQYELEVDAPGAAAGADSGAGADPSTDPGAGAPKATGSPG
ncbi:hypothetical protein [Montanilutibacter psychrotolerans]|uniref:Uncharacterized protein n=1 Tax=Montanilutibacter psychrotolerans TaxID=1327343 RepID=A0A3M8SV95_9GAMM|nr:hypothetical protein [Lysobacter psychrotolerans]RNF85268.1 hypothetical protein EER27_05755 [Lysobacter psychrotolerans]